MFCGSVWMFLRGFIRESAIVYLTWDGIEFLLRFLDLWDVKGAVDSGINMLFHSVNALDVFWHCGVG